MPARLFLGNHGGTVTADRSSSVGFPNWFATSDEGAVDHVGHLTRRTELFLQKGDAKLQIEGTKKKAH